MASVYSPQEDSFFFAEFLKKLLSTQEGNIEYLDMGTGSGILSEVAAEVIGKEHILAADKNPEAVAFVSKKGFTAVTSDLFENISGTFDLITFNAPYLPKDDREPEDSAKATTGGKHGDEVAAAFLHQAIKHLNPRGKILLLISNLTPMENLQQFHPKTVATKKLFMEELKILECSKEDSKE